MNKRKVYIVSVSHISAQEPFSSYEDFRVIPMEGCMVPCKEPDFKPYIPPMTARRMNSILKRSITVSENALEKAGIECPDAIISGSGCGCVADTEVFLSKMLEDGETMLNPSRFICSTPNTIGSQIAISLGCHGHNSTHVNDSFAFEGALLDSMMLLQKGSCLNVLLCAADQLTEGLYGLLNRDSIWKGIPVSEGAVAFVLSAEKSGAMAQVEDIVQTRSNPSWELERMLSANSLNWCDIDFVMTSLFPEEDGKPFDFIPESIPHITYKQFSGHYFTASSFGMLICSQMLAKIEEKPARILLAGCNKSTYSFTLISNVCIN